MIPSSFDLLGITWQVVESDHINEMGRCERDKATIWIQAGLPDQIKQATFCHELVHAMWFAMGKTEHNEQEVDLLGSLLHQYMVTATVADDV